jgi:hypothetical protein
MLEYLKKLKNDPEGPFDALFFIPGSNKDEVHIEASQLKDPGQSLGGSDLGHTYEVLLFRDDEEKDELTDIDRFEAIFSDPYEYASNLIMQNWFGIMVRKTTTSSVFIQRLFDKMQQT